jgi:AcrR family transcriptional regulator
MARTKVFDPHAALEAAMRVFWDKGYEATSLDDLLTAMKIGRQSMYDTFGDKKQLYLAALEHYVQSGAQATRRRLSEGGSPLAALESFLLQAARGGDEERARGCMYVNAISEFGKQDDKVAAILDHACETTERLFSELLARARQAGELPPGLNIPSAASFLHTTLRGMRIGAKSGASVEQLSGNVAFAMAALKATAAG